MAVTPPRSSAALLEGKISKLPSDYFGTNIFIGASTMSKEEIRRRDRQHVVVQPAGRPEAAIGRQADLGRADADR